MSLILKLDKEGGFCWQIWCIAEHYLEAKKNGLQFYLDDSDYLFKHKNGWRDYFASLNIYEPSLELQQPIVKRNSLSFYDQSIPHYQYNLQEYRKCLEEILVLSPDMQQKVREAFTSFGLEKGQYGACMIRRGDKMFSESKYIDTSTFLDTLVEKNIDKIYIQTDDYQVYLDALAYVQKTYPEKNIQIFTLCPTWKQGTICYKAEYNFINSHATESRNHEYVETLLNRFKKTVDEYSPSEMKEHVEEMIAGFDICIHSKHLTLDLQSNVTRQLFVRHDNPDDVLLLVNNRPSFHTPFSTPRWAFNV